MKIIDAQVHIWTKTVTPPSGLHRKVSAFTAEDCLKEMDEAGVDAALIHPPSGWDPDANAYAVESAAKYPDRYAVMGQFPLLDPENRKLIRGWRNQPGMMGLRWAFLSAEQQVWLYDGSLDWLWPAAEEEGLPIAMMGGLFLPKFREIAERHPNLKLILDHCGLNRHGQDAEAFIHLEELAALAKLPKVEGAEDIHYVDRLIAQLEAKAKLERPILVHALLETVLFESGRLVLVAPPEAPATLSGTMVIAWNGSNESARTIALAHPFIAKAERVIVLSVEGGMVPGPTGQDVVRSLGRSGIRAEAVGARGDGRSPGDAILSEAARLDAHLLV